MLENEETSESTTDADVFYGNSEETESTDAVIDNETTEESCLLYTSPSPRDQRGSRMPSSA